MATYSSFVLAAFFVLVAACEEGNPSSLRGDAAQKTVLDEPANPANQGCVDCYATLAEGFPGVDKQSCADWAQYVLQCTAVCAISDTPQALNDISTVAEACLKVLPPDPNALGPVALN
jgi:hypothetical protein